MIEPPDGCNNLPDNVQKHYYMMYAEMTGHTFLHDGYCEMAGWMITKLWYDRTTEEEATAEELRKRLLKRARR